MVEFLHGEIKDILPHNLLTPEIYSISYAVGEAMRRWGRFCASVHLYAEISCVPEEALDLMAIEMNTQYYDQSMNRKMREQLIMQSLVWHLRAGTPSVLNEFLATVLGGGYIEEWMEYDGEPYHFRAYAKVDEGMEIPLGYVTEIKRQLNTYKNVRSWLEDFFLMIQTAVTETIEVSSQLELFTEFYARNNRAYLLLDGSWGLDGLYYLNGYKTENMDLYPVRLRISGEIPVAITCGKDSAMQIESSANLELAAETIFDVTGQAVQTIHIEDCLGIVGKIENGCEAAGHLRVENNLWYLDRTYLLDGTKILNAQIFDYDL